MPWPRPGIVFAPSPDEQAGEGKPHVVVLPEADLLDMTRALRPPSRRGVLASFGRPPEEVRRHARLLAGPPTIRRPLHPLLSPEVPIQRLEADDCRSKDAVVAAVVLRAASCGLRRRALLCLEQALDELLLNALVDAPASQAGRSRPGGSPSSGSPPLEALAAAGAQVLCGGDEERFVVAVHDRFGRLRRRTVLHHLGRCASAQAARQSPFQPGSAGAGVGLFLIASCASELLFRLRAGRRSEVVCAVSASSGPPRLRALFVDDDEEREDAVDAEPEGRGR